MAKSVNLWKKISMFASEIRDSVASIENPTLTDLDAFMSRIRFDESYGLSISGSEGVDGGLELNGFVDGIAIHGAEDSPRGSFAFFFVDAGRSTEKRNVSIF
jgi:hypothetical protein